VLSGAVGVMPRRLQREESFEGELLRVGSLRERSGQPVGRGARFRRLTVMVGKGGGT